MIYIFDKKQIVGEVGMGFWRLEGGYCFSFGERLRSLKQGNGSGDSVKQLGWVMF